MPPAELGFPLGIRLTHFFNFLFLSLLVRSGVEVLGAHPKLYWRDDASPGTEWLRVARKPRPEGAGGWTAEDEIVPLSPWVALPGRNHLGLGRHWHFWAAVGWIVTGALYLVLLFTSPEWHRLVPTSWAIVPAAWHALGSYVYLKPPDEGAPFNALQQLVYFALIFGLAPLQIATALAMSPALTSRFPGFLRAFGGRQAARSLHFLGLIAFVAFFVVHLAMVVAHGLGREMAKIVLGGVEHSHRVAIALGAAGIVTVVAFNVIGTVGTLRWPKRVKRLLEVGIDSLRRALFHHWHSRQHYARRSPFARVNGRPPRNERYQRAAAEGFASWRLEVNGLVATPRSFSLEELRAMPSVTVSSLHVCIQGWTYFAEWTGVPLGEIVARCRPLPGCRYAVVRTMDEKWERPGHGDYYEVIDLETATASQTLLAYAMNGAPLAVPHGAPLRLRVENQLGYKMAKWVCGIEFVADFRAIGAGQGGWRDDVLDYYPSDAGI